MVEPQIYHGGPHHQYHDPSYPAQPYPGQPGPYQPHLPPPDAYPASYGYPPPYPYPPPYAYPPPYGYGPQDNSLGTASLIFGILALVASVTLFFGLVPAIVAVVTGYMARQRGQRYGTAGLVMGLIAIVITVAVIVLIIIAGSLAGW